MVCQVRLCVLRRSAEKSAVINPTMNEEESIPESTHASGSRSQLERAAFLSFAVLVGIIVGFALLSAFADNVADHFDAPRWVIWLAAIVVVQLSFIISFLGRILNKLEKMSERSD